jgi:hypothetical protein
MPEKKIERFYCPEHGWVLLHKCVLCEAKRYAHAIRTGRMQPFELKEGEDDSDGISLIQIKLKARLLRKQRWIETERQRIAELMKEKELSSRAMKRILNKQAEGPCHPQDQFGRSPTD